MEAYAQALTYAIPFFTVLMCIEALIGYFKGVKVIRGADTISSLSSGITNTIKDVLGLSVAIISYGWLYRHFAVFTIENTVLVYIIAFVVIDFAGYWMHRYNHEINFLWNRHMIHHSSEEFNLACALRQSIGQFLSFIAIFMVPAAVVGVPPEVIAFIAPIHLFAQFWYHTTLINKMGFLEYIIVTPSHHRVHHAINSQYLDKNYGQIFIFWDRFFGTFQSELATEPAVYGVKKAVQTWNPILINFQHIWILFTDAWRTESWKDKLTLWFRKTGYRPSDVVKKYPISIIEDAYKQEKYETNPSFTQLAWSWFQLALTLLLMFYMFNRLGDLTFPDLLLYAVYLFSMVYSFTTLLDKNPSVVWAESFHFLFGIFLLAKGGWDWFGINNYFSTASLILAAIMVLSMVLTLYWSRDFQKDQAVSMLAASKPIRES